MSGSGESREAGLSALRCEIDGKAVPLRAEDLTTAGFFIETTTPYAMDREVEITVRSTVGELFARGQVVQVVGSERARKEGRRPGFGLLFTNLEDDQRAFIGLTLDAHARNQRAQAEAAARAQRSIKPPPKASVAPRAGAASSMKPPTPAPRPPSAPLKPAPPPQSTAELKQVAAELRAELTKLQGKTAWTALGLEADSGLGAAKEAFLRHSKRVHPHKFARHNSQEISQLATEVFIAYKRAYDVLTKLAPRANTTTNVQAPARGARRTLTSIAPKPSASIHPGSPRSTGNRSRSR